MNTVFKSPTSNKTSAEDHIYLPFQIWDRRYSRITNTHTSYTKHVLEHTRACSVFYFQLPDPIHLEAQCFRKLLFLSMLWLPEGSENMSFGTVSRPPWPLTQKSSVNSTLQQNKQKHTFEFALQMLSSSGAGGLVTLQFWQLPGGVRTNRVTAEVPQFPRVNVHRKILRIVGICGPSVKTPFVPTRQEAGDWWHSAENAAGATATPTCNSGKPSVRLAFSRSLSLSLSLPLSLCLSQFSHYQTPKSLRVRSGQALARPGLGMVYYIVLCVSILYYAILYYTIVYQ